MMTPNLISDDKLTDFFVWIDKTSVAWKLLEATGRLKSITRNSGEDNLVYVPNDKPVGMISPFQANLIHSYRIEFSLEEYRRNNFQNYPSRLDAIFLFDNIGEAKKYAYEQPWHMDGRVLLQVQSMGEYQYSKHDVGWIDALLANIYNDKPTFDPIAKSYWSGETVEGKSIKTRKGIILEKPIFEILFAGTMRIPNWNDTNKKIKSIETFDYEKVLREY